MLQDLHYEMVVGMLAERRDEAARERLARGLRTTRDGAAPSWHGGRVHMMSHLRSRIGLLSV